KRIAPAASYGSMQKDSADHALIRLLVNQTDKAMDLLSREGYIFDIMPVIAIEIPNRPGTLAEMAKKFGEEGININYVYGSALPDEKKSLFVFSPEDIDAAARIFPK
ncbi:MAG: amino acid-binding protein, partial [Deltaproteobacteria bacterium]|nr:amino acid-binding protein [Deltaproteobacteria bacterium]